MALPNGGAPGTGGGLNANSIYFSQIPGFTPLWSAGYGLAPFNTPATAPIFSIDAVKAPEEPEDQATASESE